MINKRSSSVEEAIAGITDGSTLMISGFGESGRPNMLIAAVLDSGVRDLTLVSNNAGDGLEGLAALFLAERVSKLCCSFPRGAMQDDVGRLVNAGKLELDVMPQGTLAERIRAAGAGVGAFFTPTGYGTDIAKNKETRIIDGIGHVMEYALHADFALVKAQQGDRWGNITYDQLARNFSPLMCMAAKHTIVEVDEFVELGEIDPANVITPGIFVDSMVLTKAVPAQAWRVKAA